MVLAALDGVDEWLANPLNLVLKARQLGITWLAVGYALWKLLTKPGTRVLIVSINEDEAIKVVNRMFDMFNSLPEHLRFECEITKPSRGARPSTLIEFTFKDGRISSAVGLPSTRRAGHGEVGTLVLLDEFARHEYARDSWKAMFAVADNGGQIIVISTANGVSNEQTGEGNFYHHLYVNGEAYGINIQFLPWSLHPDRDEDWYANVAKALPPHDRAEQYPLTPEDAFINTGECWFDLEALAWYSQEAALEHRAAHRLQARRAWRPRQAACHRLRRDPRLQAPRGGTRLRDRRRRGDRSRHGLLVRVRHRPRDDGARSRVPREDRPRRVRGAAALPRALVRQRADRGRDGRRLRRAGDHLAARRTQGPAALPALYRHTIQDRPDGQMMANYGFPINSKTRPQVINQIEQAIREKTVPAMPRQLIMECRTFVRQKTLPSPRAQEGSNDDRVMAFGLTLEMYRIYGHHERRVKRSTKTRTKPHAYPWQKKGRAA
jgi:hypothetical protein